MTEDIKTRLKDSSENCLNAYEKWVGNKKDEAAKEELHSAVHELRKVASRLEIDLAVSDGADSGRKQIPIPAHRDARKNVNKDKGNESPGNSSDDAESEAGGKPQSRGRRGRSSGPRKAASGGE